MNVLEAAQRAMMMFAFVFLVLLILYILIQVFSKFIGSLEKATTERKNANPSLAMTDRDLSPFALTEKESEGPWGGTVNLKNVDEQTAAMIMAIVSDESGIPLSELVFKRISLVEKNERPEEESK